MRFIATSELSRLNADPRAAEEALDVDRQHVAGRQAVGVGRRRSQQPPAEHPGQDDADRNKDKPDAAKPADSKMAPAKK